MRRWRPRSTDPPAPPQPGTPQSHQASHTPIAVTRHPTCSGTNKPRAPPLENAAFRNEGMGCAGTRTPYVAQRLDSNQRFMWSALARGPPVQRGRPSGLLLCRAVASARNVGGTAECGHGGIGPSRRAGPQCQSVRRHYRDGCHNVHIGHGNLLASVTVHAECPDRHRVGGCSAHDQSDATDLYMRPESPLYESGGSDMAISPTEPWL